MKKIRCPLLILLFLSSGYCSILHALINEGCDEINEKVTFKSGTVILKGSEEEVDAANDKTHSFMADSSLKEQGIEAKLLVYNQSLPLNLKCLHSDKIYPSKSGPITFLDRGEKVNSLRFSFYYKVNYGWDKHHRERFAVLDLIFLQIEINGEFYNLEMASQQGRIYRNSSGILIYGFKNHVIGGFEFRNVKLKVEGKYNCLEYDMEGEKVYFLSCTKATFNFEIFQNK